MDILACKPEENSYNILSSAATMLFHGLPGGDVHGVVEEMDRRGKSESVAISSAIDMGESETVSSLFCPPGMLARAAWQASKHYAASSTQIQPCKISLTLQTVKNCLAFKHLASWQMWSKGPYHHSFPSFTYSLYSSKDQTNKLCKYSKIKIGAIVLKINNLP